jgi:hypothetical protein
VLSLQLHGGIPDLIISCLGHCSIILNLNIPAEHVIFWDSHIIEPQEAIILCVVSEFRADVSDLDSWKNFMSLEISDLNNEILHSMSLPVDD